MKPVWNNMMQSKLLFQFFLLFQLFLPTVGALPRMTFALVNNTNQPELNIVESELLECADRSCVVSEPLEIGGPQGLHCWQMSCRAGKYGDFRRYIKIALTLDDGTVLTSNVFSTLLFLTPYEAVVEPDRIVVQVDALAVRPGMFFHPLTNLLIVLVLLLLLTLYFAYSVARFFRNRRNKMRTEHDSLPNPPNFG